MTHIAGQCRADETKKMLTQLEVCRHASGYLILTHRECIQRTIKRQISEPVEVAFSRPGPRMWDNILIAFGEKVNLATSTYTAKAKSELNILHT